jgi:hypothetical protein
MIKKEFAMKHYNELINLEESIHKVEDFKNIFKLLIAGIESEIDMKVIKSVLYSIEQNIIDASDSLNESFQTVWNAVRDEDKNTFTTAGFQQSFMSNPTPIPTLTTTNFSALTTADIKSFTTFTNAQINALRGYDSSLASMNQP